MNEPATAWTPDLWDVIRDSFNYGGYDEVRKVFPDPNLKVVVQTGFRSYNDYDDYMQSPVSFDNRLSPAVFGPCTIFALVESREQFHKRKLYPMRLFQGTKMSVQRQWYQLWAANRMIILEG